MIYCPNFGGNYKHLAPRLSAGYFYVVIFFICNITEKYRFGLASSQFINLLAKRILGCYNTFCTSSVRHF